MTLSILRISAPALMAVLLLAVAGCGGGGGSGGSWGGSSGSGSGGNTVPPPAANRAPTISGTPAPSVTAGQAYAFQPSASDPDGQALTFSITNMPSWAAFNAATGRLSGTPAAGNAGTYANIVISVSDRAASAALPAFTITVQAAPVATAGSATLSWRAPTTNEDGTALTNLAGYRVRYGTNTSALTNLVDLASPAATTVTIQGLTAGTWYFVLHSYTNTGVESDPTAPVSKTIG